MCLNHSEKELGYKTEYCSHIHEQYIGPRPCLWAMCRQWSLVIQVAPSDW
jgi:hypothetical protein